jgi:hypothetical protein
VADTTTSTDRAAGTTRRPRKRFGRTAKLFLVEVFLFVAFVVSIDLPLTGLEIHEWLGIALAVALTVHIVQHAGWLASTTRRFVTTASFHNRVNYVLGVALFLGFASITVSGLVISHFAMPFFGIHPPGGWFWHWLHVWSAEWMIWVIAVHLGFNWQWLVSATKRLFGRQPARTGGAR